MTDVEVYERNFWALYFAPSDRSTMKIAAWADCCWVEYFSELAVFFIFCPSNLAYISFGVEKRKDDATVSISPDFKTSHTYPMPKCMNFYSWSRDIELVFYFDISRISHTHIHMQVAQYYMGKLPGVCESFMENGISCRVSRNIIEQYYNVCWRLTDTG